MTGTPRYGMSLDPRALDDLLQAPGDIRDLALAQLQEVVNGTRRGGPLAGDLAGYRKLYIDSRRAWRLVYGLRPAPPGATHATQVHIVAVRPRHNGEVYDRAAARIGKPRRRLSALAHAARARSPHLAGRPIPGPGTARTATPGIPQPATLPTSMRGPVR